MHIGMNMLSFFYMGASLERIFGTLPFLYILMLLVLRTSCAHRCHCPRPCPANGGAQVQPASLHIVAPHVQ